MVLAGGELGGAIERMLETKGVADLVDQDVLAIAARRLQVGFPVSVEPHIASLRRGGGIIGAGRLVSEAGGAETDLPRFTLGFDKMDIRHRGPLGQACAG